MNTTAADPEHLRPDATPVWDGLFPVGYQDVGGMYDDLTTVTAANVRAFVDVRLEGPSDDMLTALYHARVNVGSPEAPVHADLVDWHRRQGRLGSPETQLLYRFGQLYGTRLCSDRYYYLTGERLRATDADAYRIAMSVLVESHQEQPNAQAGWPQQHRRELSYLGTNKLSVLTAMLSDRISRQFIEVAPGQPLPAEDEALGAFYQGMLDASIFFNTHARWVHGLQPQRFIDDGYLEQPFSPGPLGTPVAKLMEELVRIYPFDEEEPELGQPFRLDIPEGADVRDYMTDVWLEHAQTYDWYELLAQEVDAQTGQPVERQYRALARLVLEQLGANLFGLKYRIELVGTVVHGETITEFAERNATGILEHMQGLTPDRMAPGKHRDFAVRLRNLLVHGLSDRISPSQFGIQFIGFMSGFFAARRWEISREIGDPIPVGRISEEKAT